MSANSKIFTLNGILQGFLEFQRTLSCGRLSDDGLSDRYLFVTIWGIGTSVLFGGASSLVPSGRRNYVCITGLVRRAGKYIAKVDYTNV
jgi:hypothetical protein